MVTETRSRNGCWTCKLRRKKCDERSPLCLRCQSLNITCHGFGERPEWMDSGARESAELSSIKSVIAENLQYKRSCSEKQPSAQSSTAISVSYSPPSALHQPHKITKATVDFEESDNGQGNASWFERVVDYSVPNNSARQNCSQTDGSDCCTQMGNTWQSISLEDAVLIMRFFEDMPCRHSPFSCISFCCYDQGRYLWFVSKSQCLYLTTLALEAYHEHLSAASQELNNREEFIIRYGRAVAELQRSVGDLHEPVLGYGEADVNGLCILTCVLLLTEFNVGILRTNSNIVAD